MNSELCTCKKDPEITCILHPHKNRRAWLPAIKVSHIHAYEYKGWKFEYYKSKPISPWPLKNDLEPRKSAGRQFYKMLAEFEQLTPQEQEKCRIV